MKPTGRTKLYCYKRLSWGIIDGFHVIVPSGKAADTKKEYERQGYKVV